MKIDCESRLSVEEITAYAHRLGPAPKLSADAAFRARIRENRHYLEARIAKGGDIYGVTTGFGSSSRNHVDAAAARRLSLNLSRYHGCGVGPLLAEEACASILLVRLNCLARGVSGVSIELLERLELCLEKRVIPAIPAQGSVGASGDLTPLSYVAGALAGERDVYHHGKITTAAAAFAAEGVAPYQLKEREALAIMNGTSAMTGLAALAWSEAKALADRASELTGLLVELLEGRSAPFTDLVNAQKPHPGQLEAARRITAFLARPETRYHRATKDGERAEIQDAYSVRCAPQVIGVLYDVLAMTKTWIETEINSVNDNPVVLDRAGEGGEILNGGLFFGGHIAAACDALKTAVANVVNLADRQLALLLDRRHHGRLPENLVAERALGAESTLHHGFKAMQITLSALAAECAKQSMPMSVFSRPTESSNQDVVSMGTIAARDLRVITAMARDGLAIHAMALRQGFYVAREGDADGRLNPAAARLLEEIGTHFQAMVEDRALDREIGAVGAMLFAPRAPA